MRAIDIAEFGGPEVLVVTELPMPVAGPGEVLIEVAAAGINRPDVVQRQGFYPPPEGASPIPGLEVAGTIVAVAGDVTSWSVGDVVCALLSGGGYAEYATASAALCLPVPKGLSLQQAAALPETFFTVWSNLFDRAQLKAGETLLVHGGSGGIGTTAIQLASALGVRVFATAGGPEKCADCEAMGASSAINYKQQDFVDAVRKLTDGRGVDVILDMVGGDYIDRNIKAAAVDGRIVSIGFLRGSKVEVNFMSVMLKRLTLTGSTLRPRDLDFKSAIARQLKEKVWPLIASGQICPRIDTVMPLSDAAAAHRKMESNTHVGKIVLAVDSET
ncbi:MAG: NAD(P)H-quinone oxidoreductase [Pseudomonadales bacterium]